ncbi:MAG TPA: adenylosuccinate synthase [Saprospiraceae bacterium]|nr:adenylosuccinate synthase [Saprospiraceae bacterium]
MTIDVILGLQWGDEGKGKIVDYLADQYNMVCRFQGGPNAGHTIKIEGNKYILHTIPSGIFRKGTTNLIGNGVVIDPVTFVKELQSLDQADIQFRDRLYISKKAHLILPTHRYLDLASEAFKGKEKIGSTLKGIGPTYMDKTGRNGLRTGDMFFADFESQYFSLRDKHLGLIRLYPDVSFQLKEEEEKWFEAIRELKKLQFTDGEYFVNHALKEGQKVLAEGAQGSMLDIDFGTYPYVTSSNTIASGVCSGLGIAPSRIGRVYGIAKAYCTRVGSGPFPTELNDETGNLLREYGHEFGSTTGRARRCGWMDLVQLKYTTMINGVTDLIITKLDVLNAFQAIRYCTHYKMKDHVTDEVPFDMMKADIDPVYHTSEGWARSIDDVGEFDDLPKQARNYIRILEDYLQTPVSMVSTGPERRKILTRR